MEKDVKEYSDFNSNITKIPEFTDVPEDMIIIPTSSHIANYIKDKLSKASDEIHIINRVDKDPMKEFYGNVIDDESVQPDIVIKVDKATMEEFDKDIKSCAEGLVVRNSMKGFNVPEDIKD